MRQSALEWTHQGWRVRTGEKATHYAVNDEDPSLRIALFDSEQAEPLDYYRRHGGWTEMSLEEANDRRDSANVVVSVIEPLPPSTEQPAI